MKRPAFQFYVGDWLSDDRVRHMSIECRGLYIDLLAYSWRENGIAKERIDDPAVLARLCGVSSRKFRALWTEVHDKFTLSSSQRYVNNRLELEREKLETFARKQRQNIEKRWNDDELGITTDHTSGIASGNTLLSSVFCLQTSEKQIPPKAPQGGQDAPKPRQKRSRKPDQAASTAQAAEVLAFLNTLRQGVRPTAKELRPTDENLSLIAARIAAGATVEECKHVVSVCEAETKQNPDAWQWFNSVSPFRPDNFARKLARDLQAPPPTVRKWNGAVIGVGNVSNVAKTGVIKL